MTEVLKLDPEHPQPEVIDRAASTILEGGLVAFPTETVYGLGADATNETAVRKIFEAKGRPPDNPLIVHVDGPEMLDLVASGVREKAKRLIAQFWPGPLTLVSKRKPELASSVCAGLETVAVRMPRNKIALALIHASRAPIAAPSANLSGGPSPTSAAHVLDDLGGRIDMILDGGATSIGIESTVLDVTVDPPLILRPGWITREMLSGAIGPVEGATSREHLGRSPGTRHRHYSPRARVILIEQGSRQFIEQLCEEHLKRGAVGFMGHTPVAINDANFNSLLIRDDADDYASIMYAALRELDRRGPGVILVEGISEDGKGVAVMDRLRRAAFQSTREPRI